MLFESYTTQIKLIWRLTQKEEEEVAIMFYKRMMMTVILYRQKNASKD